VHNNAFIPVHMERCIPVNSKSLRCIMYTALCPITFCTAQHCRLHGLYTFVIWRVLGLLLSFLQRFVGPGMDFMLKWHMYFFITFITILIVFFCTPLFVLYTPNQCAVIYSVSLYFFCVQKLCRNRGMGITDYHRLCWHPPIHMSGLKPFFKYPF
jgi:hypothetical protein